MYTPSLLGSYLTNTIPPFHTQTIGQTPKQKPKHIKSREKQESKMLLAKTKTTTLYIPVNH